VPLKSWGARVDAPPSLPPPRLHPASTPAQDDPRRTLRHISLGRSRGLKRFHPDEPVAELSVTVTVMIPRYWLTSRIRGKNFGDGRNTVLTKRTTPPHRRADHEAGEQS
jgi:hypothetical protein